MSRNFGERVQQIFIRERELSAIVRREFERCLAQTWPRFQRVPDADKFHPVYADQLGLPDEHGEQELGGWRLYRWHADVGIWFFLELAFNKNKFRITLLWNTTDQRPQDVDCHAHVFDPDPRSYPLGRCSPKKEWKFGTNPAYEPAAVVPIALAEMKTFSEPIITKVLEHNSSALTPNAEPTV
jgi:hypothetical protein